MARGESFGQLRAEDCEGRDPQQGRQMTGARVVADETIAFIQRLNQVSQIARFRIKPADFPAIAGEVLRQLGEPFERPFPYRVSGAGVQGYPSPRACARDRRFDLPAERLGESRPMIRPVRAGGYKGLIQQPVGASAGVTKLPIDAR